MFLLTVVNIIISGVNVCLCVNLQKTHKILFEYLFSPDLKLCLLIMSLSFAIQVYYIGSSNFLYVFSVIYKVMSLPINVSFCAFLIYLTCVSEKNINSVIFVLPVLGISIVKIAEAHVMAIISDSPMLSDSSEISVPVVVENRSTNLEDSFVEDKAYDAFKEGAYEAAKLSFAENTKEKAWKAYETAIRHSAHVKTEAAEKKKELFNYINKYKLNLSGLDLSKEKEMEAHIKKKTVFIYKYREVKAMAEAAEALAKAYEADVDLKTEQLKYNPDIVVEKEEIRKMQDARLKANATKRLEGEYVCLRDFGYALSTGVEKDCVRQQIVHDKILKNQFAMAGKNEESALFDGKKFVNYKKLIDKAEGENLD
jgi:hypothetical protein